MKWQEALKNGAKKVLKALKPVPGYGEAENGTRKEKIIVVVKQNWKLILVLLLVIFLLLRGCGFGQNKLTYNFSSALMKSLDIDELSTSELTYNGIATVLHENSDKARYHIRYNSKIKVGINMSDIRFIEDAKKKTVNVTLPQVRILEVVIDPNSISFIPNNFSADMRTAVIDAKNDALAKSNETPELISTAEDNLKSIIEALTLPLIQDAGYKLVWQNGENEQ